MILVDKRVMGLNQRIRNKINQNKGQGGSSVLITLSGVFQIPELNVFKDCQCSLLNNIEIMFLN